MEASFVGPMSEFDFEPYLSAIATHYSKDGKFYTPTDALLPLEVRSVAREEQEGREKKVEQWPVLEGLRKYAIGDRREHVLLAGRPGSGKSTALRQLVVGLAAEGLVPVLVQLKGDRTVPELIKAEFRARKVRVTDEQIEDWLWADRLVLLLDGVNEIPNDNLRRSLAQFREDNSTVPMIFTTRDLSLGGDLGIGKRFEMKPLSEPQLRDFVEKYLGDKGDRLLAQLRGKLREISETPLLLKMLCDVFDPETDQIPQNKGELFQWFDRDYERIKKGVEYVPVSENFWLFKLQILQHLAFATLQADIENPTEAWYSFSRGRAAGILEDWLRGRGMTDAPTKAALWVKDLVDCHLLQDAAKPGDIEFHHQLFQEYYAAEYLKLELERRPEWLQKQPNDPYTYFQYFYLNYLKWTESVAIVLSLMEEEKDAVGLVKQALEVDLMLGARLAGEVRSRFQSLMTDLLSILELQNCLKSKLLANAHSSEISKQTVISWQEDSLDPIENYLASSEHMILHEPNRYVHAVITPYSDDIDYQSELLVQFIEHWNWGVRTSAGAELFKLDAKIAIKELLELLNSPRMCIRHSSAFSICIYGKKEGVPVLLETFQKLNYKDDFIDYEWSSSLEDAWITESFYGVWFNDARCAETLYALGQTKSEEALPELFRAINCSDNDDIVQAAIEALGDIPSEESLTELFKIIESSKRKYCRVVAVRSLSDISLKDIPVLLVWVKSILRLLLRVLEDPDESVRAASSEALGRFKNDRAAYILPSLFKLLSTEYVKEALDAIQGIQANCKFYNYEIFHSPPANSQPTQQPPQATTINQYPNVTEVQIIEHIDNYHESSPRDPPP
jgi:HEAT repeat protein